MSKTNNKGFSLIELIIVIAIMAVLVAVIVPQYINYVGRSKRIVDINNAAEFAKACQSSAIFDEYSAPTDEEYYQGFEPTPEEAKGIWSFGFVANDDFANSLDLEHPSSFLEYFCASVGCIPVSATNKDFIWYVKYNKNTMNIVSINLVDGNTGNFYEIYPDGSDFLSNGP